MHPTTSAAGSDLPVQKQRLHAWRLVLGVVAAVGVVGCAAVPEDPPLEASLVNLRFTMATVFETVAVAEVRLENVSPAEMRVTGAAHKVTVNGRKLGRGLSGAEVVVPRLGSTTQEVEFHLRNISVARTLHELTRAPLVDYELDSTVYVGRAGGGDRAVRMKRTGRLDLNRLGGVGPGAGAGELQRDPR